MTTTMELARAERADLLAFLETLTPEQWEAQTLCDAWNVRQVVAHVLSFEGLSQGTVLRQVAGAALRLDRVTVERAEEFDRSPEALLAVLREHLTPDGITAGLGGRVGLVDALLHHQDIRRPLGLPREIPAERLRRAAPIVLFGPPIRGILRVYDLRLVATDLDWSFGRGPEVHGPAEALLLVAAGRRGISGELSGPGQPRLAGRVDG